MILFFYLKVDFKNIFTSDMNFSPFPQHSQKYYPLSKRLKVTFKAYFLILFMKQFIVMYTKDLRRHQL